MKLIIAATALFVAHAQETPVQIIGAEGEVDEALFPLGKCQGDCNRHRDCEGTLMCFARGGATKIPGCDGELPMDGTDICWDPNDTVAPGVIANIGRRGNPPQVFPLQHCHGTCLQDSDCAEGLVCFFRSAIVNEVPGCPGEPLPDGADYCVFPADLPYGVGGSTGSNTTTTTTTTPVTPVVATPTETTPVDTTPVTPEANVDTLTELPENYLMIAFNNDGPQSALPLSMCQGDCNSDDDCAGDNVCFQRAFNEPVPGCVGIALDYYDYCIDPTAAVIEVDPAAPLLLPPAGLLGMVFSNGSPNEVLPLKHCHGDCDDDMDCEDGLVCFIRETETVPGCSGTAANNVDYCIKSEDIPKQVTAPTTSESSSAEAVVKTALAAIMAVMAL